MDSLQFNVSSQSEKFLSQRKRFVNFAHKSDRFARKFMVALCTPFDRSKAIDCTKLPATKVHFFCIHSEGTFIVPAISFSNIE